MVADPNTSQIKKSFSCGHIRILTVFIKICFIFQNISCKIWKRLMLFKTGNFKNTFVILVILFFSEDPCVVCKKVEEKSLRFYTIHIYFESNLTC